MQPVHADCASILSTYARNEPCLRVVLRFRMNRFHPPPAVHVPQAIRDAKKHPVPFMVVYRLWEHPAIHRNGLEQCPRQKIKAAKPPLFIHKGSVASDLNQNINRGFVCPECKSAGSIVEFDSADTHARRSSNGHRRGGVITARQGFQAGQPIGVWRLKQTVNGHKMHLTRRVDGWRQRFRIKRPLLRMNIPRQCQGC